MSKNAAFLAWAREGVEKGYHDMLANDPACVAMITTMASKFLPPAMKTAYAAGCSDGLAAAADIAEKFSAKTPPVPLPEIVAIIRELGEEEEAKACTKKP